MRDSNCALQVDADPILDSIRRKTFLRNSESWTTTQAIKLNNKGDPREHDLW